MDQEPHPSLKNDHDLVAADIPMAGDSFTRHVQGFGSDADSTASAYPESVFKLASESKYTNRTVVDHAEG